MDKAAPDPLQAIRVRIDAIDEAVHRLLIERSGVIAELIHIKGLSKPGAAFRPDREADMMRRLVMRHEGNLPLVTVEHIWREIITTFTAMQAPFGVAAGPAEDPLAMRDLVRFYFGFSIPVTNCESSEDAIGEWPARRRTSPWWPSRGRADGGRTLRQLRPANPRQAPLHRNSRPPRESARLCDRAAAQRPLRPRHPRLLRVRRAAA